MKRVGLDLDIMKAHALDVVDKYAMMIDEVLREEVEDYGRCGDFLDEYGPEGAAVIVLAEIADVLGLDIEPDDESYEYEDIW